MVVYSVNAYSILSFDNIQYLFLTKPMNVVLTRTTPASTQTLLLVYR